MAINLRMRNMSSPALTGLMSLPNELLLSLIDHNPRISDIHSLRLANRRFYSLFPDSLLRQRTAAALQQTELILLPTHKSGHTILHWAAAHKDLPLLQLIVNNTGTPTHASLKTLSSPDNNRISPLLTAIVNHDLFVTKLLIRGEANTNIGPHWYIPSLPWPFATMEREWTHPLSLEAWGVDAVYNSQSWGTEQRHTGPTRKFLTNGTGRRVWENIAKYGTPLMHAVYNALHATPEMRGEWLEVVGMLGKAGADPYVHMGDWRQPLVLMAVFCEDVEVLRLLLGRGQFTVGTELCDVFRMFSRGPGGRLAVDEILWAKIWRGRDGQKLLEKVGEAAEKVKKVQVMSMSKRAKKRKPARRTRT